MKDHSKNKAELIRGSLFSDRWALAVCSVLVLVTLAVFWQVKAHEFINYDDGLYITENTHVQAGLSIESLKWAFRTGHACNWHPVTWLSHMLDVQLLGLNPGRHHLVNVLFHIANALLLFLVLRRMTKALWPSAFVAALFALHPLHVESVAWVAERKDVLSTLFWLLTMGAYIFYVERPGYRRYLPVLGFFALGLMSKPMLVTLPFVLLLLDYWPLGRLRPNMQDRGTPRNAPSPEKPAGKKRKAAGPSPQSIVPVKEHAAPPGQWSMIRPLLLEKVPLFVFSILSSAVTILTQERAMQSLQKLPAAERIANALVSYGMYLEKTFWPRDLAVFYPRPDAYPLWQVLGAALLLLAATFLVIRYAKRFPYLCVGWLWYLGTLVPVIGLVQVGAQAMADRYSYVSLIGIFIMIAWGVPEWLKEWPWRNTVLVALSGVALSACVVITWEQLHFWQDSVTLFRHALKVTADNCVTHNNLGSALHGQGKTDDAITHFRAAIGINPEYAEAWANLGVAYRGSGRTAEAIEAFQRALRINPEYAEAWNGLGNAYGESGQMANAIEALEQQALRINPEYVEAWNNLGLAYQGSGQTAKAIEAFQQTLRINPLDAKAWYSIGVAHWKSGQTASAVEAYQQALRINPKYAEAWNNLGLAYGKADQTANAVEAYQQALSINPDNAGVWNNLGLAYAKTGQTVKAIEAFRQSLRINPGSARAWFNLGLLYGQSGQKEEVAEVYKKLKAIDPAAAEEFARILPPS